jgi:tetratricopeptide (TPR) repeat protein
MLQRQTMIDDIRRGLAVYENYVRPGGTLNLTDSNVHAEDFVAGLLNGIHGWNLVSTNQATANYPCIDLIDETLAFGVQVTSESGSDKLTKTLECANTHQLAEKVKHLKVFLLIPKQEKYSIHAKCPGIAFNWEHDVLDFKDALQSIVAISHLPQLHRVHQYVVQSLPSIFPQQRYHPLPLSVPVTDPVKAWLSFSSRATSLVGRDEEQAQLQKFLNSDSTFSWLLMTGDAGSGKSRLALDLCRQVGNEWHAGFFNRTKTNFDWSQFSPIRKTLIVIDYVASRAEEVGEIVLTLSRTSSEFTEPVRVLLVEREKASWWTDFSREASHSESAEIVACQYGDPLELPGMSPRAILQIAKEVVLARGGLWDIEAAREFLARMYNYDRRGRPLFAMIVALHSEAEETDAGRPNLLQAVLRKEAARRRELIPDTAALNRMENLLLLATLTGGLAPMAGNFAHLAASNVQRLLPDVELLDQALYNDLTSAAGGIEETLSGLQPDILGERFILDRLSIAGIAGQNARTLQRAAWSWQPSDVRVVAIRCVLDFPSDPAIRTFFDLPLETAEARHYWAEMVADLIPHAVAAVEFAEQQLQRLRSIADDYPHEQDLQEATARADYNFALPFMFQDNRLAVRQFDAAIARIGTDSLIGKMALHNRAIVQRADDERYDAFEVFTMMIDSHDAPDEMRACAFNNRADVYAERGEHALAIRDRSEVLALKATSPDRRYIALVRRSRSHAAMGNVPGALEDLGRILEIWDITQHQKAEARLQRASIMRDMERWQDARADLQAVLDSQHLFDGTRATALVDLAEVSRRTGDHAQADTLLSQAVNDPDIYEETWIDALIVGGLLLEDANDLEGACELWRKVLAAPNASDQQVRRARNRLDAISQKG